jgi:hypothetical protein
MRFLRVFFTISFLGLMLLGFIVIGVIEGRLWWEGDKLASDFLTVKRLANQARDKYWEQCLADNEIIFESQKSKPRIPLKGYRLRFTSDTHYLIEAVCTSTFKGPFQVMDKSLGFGVKKLKGSGIFIPVTQTGVVESGEEDAATAMVLLGDRYIGREVGLVDGLQVSRLTSPQNWFSEGEQAAETECEGWGNSCCDPVTQVGVGTPEERVLDCRGQCYEVCRERPIIVYFNSDPLMNTVSRSVVITGSEVVVTFGFEVADTDSQIALVVLNFGDGEKYTAKSTKETAEHTYRCAQGTCRFEAKIEATDSEGLKLADSRLSEITVILKK